MSLEQVATYKNSEVNNHDLLDRVIKHCYFNESTGQFICKKCNHVVNIDWSRSYVYCFNHGMIWLFYNYLSYERSIVKNMEEKMYKRYCKSCGRYDVDLYPYDKNNYVYNPMMCRCCIISEINRLRNLIKLEFFLNVILQLLQ